MNNQKQSKLKVRTATANSGRLERVVRCHHGRWRVQWYGRDGCIRQTWRDTLKEAQSEYWKHRDVEIYDERPSQDT